MKSVPEISEAALEFSKADDCIVLATESSTANVRWANNSSTTNGVGNGSHISVISVFGKRIGVVSKSYFTEENLESIVRESEKAAEGKPDSEDYKPLLEGKASEGWGESGPPTSIDIFSEFAPQLSGLFSHAEKSDVKLFGYAEHSATTTHLATSKGIRKSHFQLSGKVELNAKSADFARSTWGGVVTTDFKDVDLEAMYQRLEQRLEWSRTSISLEPGLYQVLMEPSAVADMLIYSYWTSSGRDADEGRTVFSKPGGGNRIGEQVFPAQVNVYSDPYEPGLGVAPFGMTTRSNSFTSVFDAGLESSKTAWIENGKLKNLIVPRYWADKQGIDPISYIDNLIMSGDGADMEEMISKTKRGLLINCLWYIREVDPQTLLLTGLTRDGVFLVENGEVKGAVNNFRFNMSPIAMLAQTVEIGRSQSTLPREWSDYFTFTKMPPLRVDNFNMSSVSQAT